MIPFQICDIFWSDVDIICCGPKVVQVISQELLSICTNQIVTNIVVVNQSKYASSHWKEQAKPTSEGQWNQTNCEFLPQKLIPDCSFPLFVTEFYMTNHENSIQQHSQRNHSWIEMQSRNHNLYELTCLE